MDTINIFSLSISKSCRQILLHFPTLINQSRPFSYSHNSEVSTKEKNQLCNSNVQCNVEQLCCQGDTYKVLGQNSVTGA